MHITNTEVCGLSHAIRGIRNNRNTWDKSDSYYDPNLNRYILGADDFKLMCKLAIAGGAHAKFMRYIVVYCDIEAPMYWWKEADTYKVGTVRNSTSTMNTIMKKEFDINDFAHHAIGDARGTLDMVIVRLNDLRRQYIDINTHIKDMDDSDEKIKLSREARDIWYALIQLLPSSYLQKSTMMMNYQVLRNIYPDRRNHKLDEWHYFCEWIEHDLPYYELITCTSVDEALKHEYGESSSFSPNL